MTTGSPRCRVAIWLLALLFPSQLTSQTPVDTAAVVRAAEAATQDWLALVDKGQLAKGWEQAATSFQLAHTQATFEQSVKSARGPFEPFRARRRFMAQYVTEVPDAPGQHVFFQYQTSVPGDRQVIETLVATFDGDRGWRVVGYSIQLDPYYSDPNEERVAESRRWLALQHAQARAIYEASIKCREPAQELESALRRHRDFLVERAGAQILKGEFLGRALQAIAAGDSNQACMALVDSVAAALARHHE